MGELNATYNFTRNNPPPNLLTMRERGQWAIIALVQDMAADQVGSLGTKTGLFKDMRWSNQYAQENTAQAYPNGLQLNTVQEFAESTSSPQANVEQLLLEQDAKNSDTKFAEDFENQLESEKIVTTWEGLAEYETGELSIGHQNHLRELIKNLVAPGLQTMEPIFQEIMEKAGGDANIGELVGDQLRLKTAGHTLTSNVDISLQERAAQEYVTAVVGYAINGREYVDPDTGTIKKLQGDHFVRKELRRLFDLVQDVATPGMFLPEEITGDPSIAQEKAQERYDYIFNNDNANESYERFMSIGLTNEHFAKALSRLDNASADPALAPDWSKGILRGMLTLLRHMIQTVAGTSLRYEGGAISDALRALAQTTIAVNQRNQQRLKDLRTGADGTSRVQNINQRLVDAVNRRFVEPLAKGLSATHQKRLDPKNPTLPGFLKAAAYTALASRDTEVRKEYDRFYRELTSPYNIGKDNSFFETIAEVTPWKEENLDWISLLRKSKHIVDMARQEANDNTRAFLNDSFDKNNYMSKKHKMAITNTVLKTDLSALLTKEGLAQGVDLERLAQLLVDPNARTAERGRLEALLRGATIKAANPNLYNLFQNQARSLANIMVHGEATIENPMLNAGNIANQFMFDASERVSLPNAAEMTDIIDKLASMYALDMQTGNDLRLTNDIMQHEMSRADATGDNGFTRLIGMQINFKELSKARLFDDAPTQMIKGYVYEIFDGDVNVEYVEQGSPREQELINDGMRLVGDVGKDSHDSYKGKRLLYKGMKGLNTYNKSIVSLTDLQHRGANLFSTNGYQSQATLGNLGRTRQRAYISARRQFNEGYTKAGTNMVPVLNNKGEIVDYRYMMSERNKQKILKKEDPFDRVLPRMFASISDRNSTKEINKDVIKLLKEEWTAGRNDPGQRFVKVSRTSEDKAGRDMWNLLPEDMQRNAKEAFNFEGIYVRDNVANLVLGFRKMTISNLKKPGEEGGSLWGKATPMVRMAEKVWLEVVSLMRIKIAILTPTVVVGNTASNTAMLLSEGIPEKYIRENVSEAISGMRQYQKDRAKATYLMRQIGSAQALGKDTRGLEVRLSRLNADLAANPVGLLVEEGLFTSITADLGVDDDTIRGSLIQKAEDALGNRGGKLGKAVARGLKELYMLPGSKGYQAAVAATQYGDFVARYTKFKYDTQVNKKSQQVAINEALAAFIYYDIPQPKYLQALNDSGLVMFTKFFLRIQPIVAKMYSQNPVSATSVLLLQKQLLASPFNENIMNYGMGDGLTNKFTNPLNLPGKVANTLNPLEPAALDWLFNPFGL